MKTIHHVLVKHVLRKLALLLSMDEHKANLCVLFWLRGDFCEHFKRNTMKKWGKIDSSKKTKQQYLLFKTFFYVSRLCRLVNPLSKLSRKWRQSAQTLSTTIRNFRLPVKSVNQRVKMLWKSINKPFIGC